MGFLDDLEKIGGGIANDIGGAGKWLISSGENFAEKTESGLTGFLETPLIILAVGVAFLMYNSNLGQVAEVTKNAAPLMA